MNEILDKYEKQLAELIVKNFRLNNKYKVTSRSFYQAQENLQDLKADLNPFKGIFYNSPSCASEVEEDLEKCEKYISLVRALEPGLKAFRSEMQKFLTLFREIEKVQEEREKLEQLIEDIETKEEDE